MAVTKLRVRIVESGRTPRDIARATGIWETRISEYSLGRRYMQTHHIYALCKELHCSVGDLVGYEDDAEDGALFIK